MSKSWEEYTNQELVNMLRKTFDWRFSKKILAILKKRGVTYGQLYDKTFDSDFKESN